MQTPYIPPRDALFALWLDNFQSLIVASPATYGLTAADATAIHTAQTLFAAAFTTATDPPTRTTPTIAEKDAKRVAAEAVIRPYAIQIRNNLGVTNQDKLDLGLNVPDPTKTAIPAPSTHPILAIIGATSGAHTLRFADSNTPSTRAKPFGAKGLEIWRVVGDAPVTTPAGALFMGMVTRQPFASSFTQEQNGKTCTYFGRWVTGTGLVGPWSAPVSMTIVA